MSFRLAAAQLRAAGAQPGLARRKLASAYDTFARHDQSQQVIEQIEVRNVDEEARTSIADEA